MSSPPGERLKKTSLDASGLTLLQFKSADQTGTSQERATLFASSAGVSKLRKKVTEFQTQDLPDKIKDGQRTKGRPKNADLVQSLSEIAEAGLRALWRSPSHRFPSHGFPANWELWLEKGAAQRFLIAAPKFGVAIAQDRLDFPEDVVVVAHATIENLALCVKQTGIVRAIAAPTITADFFHGAPVDEQAQWVQEIFRRSDYTTHLDPGYVTLLDTGVSLAHPLVAPALAQHDRHAAQPAWSVDDVKGHGTMMAGLSLFGDLTSPLYQLDPITVTNRLESSKLFPDAGQNPHHLLGAVTRDAINAVETTGYKRRTFTMAATTNEDTPHDGAPTSWSSEMDQLSAGVSGTVRTPRLLVLSAGNTDNNTFGLGNYLDRCDHDDNEIESPAQSWNSICVGAYTEKTQIPPNEIQTTSPVAPFGDLSPSSRTASWDSHWPLKPDVVLEGGNWAQSAMPPPMRHSYMSLLSTAHTYPQRSFCFAHDTSAATALAAKQLTELWSDYPKLWPETARALYVSSARWTDQMKSHLPVEPNKGDFAKLFRRYGYGVPDMERARRSASNALTLLIEDTITPYGLSEKTGGDVHNEMKLFTLPWPVAALRALGSAEITMRAALSTFIAPNPSEASRGSRYRYASHNLRFKINRADEQADRFMARISKVAEAPVGPQSAEEDLWLFGSDRRDVGSLHVDQITCKASDLARRNLIAVHPVTGWWKSKKLLQDGLPEVRFSLIVEIDAGEQQTELYAEVQTAIAAMVQSRAVVLV